MIPPCSRPPSRIQRWRTAFAATALLATAAATGAAAGSASAAPLERIDGIARTADGSFDEQIYDSMAVRGNSAYFVTNVGDGAALWQTDGTTAGTARVAELPAPGGTAARLPSLASPGAAPIVATKSRLFFILTDGLWTSDGTAAGTVRLETNEAYSYVAALSTVGERAIFTRVVPGEPKAWYVPEDETIWGSDGTPAGTVPMIHAGRHERFIGFRLFNDGTHAYFQRDGMGSIDRRIYRTDGSEAGTVPIDPTDSSTPTFNDPADHKSLAAAFEGSVVYLQAGRLVIGETTPAASFGPVLPMIAYQPSSPFLSVSRGPGGSIYVVSRAGLADSRPMLSRISATGVLEPIQDISSSDGVTFAGERVAFGDTLAFTNTARSKLWVTGGSPAATRLLREASRNSARSLTVVGDWLYFVSRDDDHGTELWKTDGTAAGTSIVEDLRPGPASSSPGSMTRLGNHLLFTAADAAGTRRQYRLAVDPSGYGPRRTPTPSPEPKAKRSPTGLIVRTDRKTDRSAPYRWSIEGRLGVPTGLPSKACSGWVDITVNRGRRVVAKRATQVSLAGDTICAYVATVRVDRRKLSPRGGVVTTTVKFRGNAELLATGGRKPVRLTYVR